MLGCCFFFLLNAAQVPSWGRNEGTEGEGILLQPWLCVCPAQGCSKANLNCCFKPLWPQLSLGKGKDLTGLLLLRLLPVQQRFAFCLLLSERSHACGLAQC